MMHRTPLRAALALTVTLLLAVGDLAGAEGEFAALVAERQAGFEDMGAAAKVFRDQLRGDAPFDSLTQVEAADVIIVRAAQLADWFPEGSGPDAYDTDARAYIWRNLAKFDRLATALAPQADALRVAAAGGDRGAVLQAFRALGGTCGDCHDSFRAD